MQLQRLQTYKFACRSATRASGNKDRPDGGGRVHLEEGLAEQDGTRSFAAWFDYTAYPTTKGISIEVGDKLTLLLPEMALS
ncbi:hypothetical protein PG984_011395 [Apiospora sp. TS-2023a]